MTNLYQNFKLLDYILISLNDLFDPFDIFEY